MRTSNRDLDHLRENIEEFIERYYNRCRLHSALGYRSPEEFEQAARTDAVPAGASMSFFRHEEIYQNDGRVRIDGKSTEAGSPDHRFDESPAGYSSASCAPAELASASPAADEFKTQESRLKNRQKAEHLAGGRVIRNLRIQTRHQQGELHEKSTTKRIANQAGKE